MENQELIDKGYIDGKKSFEHLSKEIFESFKFESVHKAMMALDWNWALGKDSEGDYNMGIPSLKTIKKEAYRLLKHAYETGEGISTGGFSSGWDSGCLYLTFSLEEASA